MFLFDLKTCLKLTPRSEKNQRVSNGKAANEPVPNLKINVVLNIKPTFQKIIFEQCASECSFGTR
jgi:hypothetical protein